MFESLPAEGRDAGPPPRVVHVMHPVDGHLSGSGGCRSRTHRGLTVRPNGCRGRVHRSRGGCVAEGAIVAQRSLVLVVWIA